MLCVVLLIQTSISLFLTINVTLFSMYLNFIVSALSRGWHGRDEGCSQGAACGHIMSSCGGMVTFFFVLFFVSYDDPNISFSS